MTSTPPRVLRRVLIANRGEIALRIMRTCRAMGLGVVAVYSDADQDAPHVRLADVAVRLGPAPARESYLKIDAVIAAARATGADAVHPGYGFLAENPLLADACAEAGLVFVGPGADVIRKLGGKRAAKLLAQSIGVPVVPGYDGDAQDTAALVAAGAGVGFPLLVKASAGGGGKGMRVVRAPEELAAAIDRARSEAEAAFGDGTLLLERYVERPRHVEVQLLGDAHGNVIHLGERECSVQRRHQKLLEETPAPTLTADQRTRMCDAAVSLGRAVGYTSAGTVEFIVDDRTGEFFFLEVNTRLQVEHPVTEAVTGLDLVREQLRVAAGLPLSVGAAPSPRGHAIEARLCAEDADAGHLPRPGLALDVGWPDADARFETALEPGTQVTGDYDSMIAKVIVHAPTRAEAAARLADVLARLRLPGVVTNAALLARVLRHPAFVAGALHTHFLDEHAAALAAPAIEGTTHVAALLAAVLADMPVAGAADQVPAGYRNVAAGLHAAGSPMTLVLGERQVATRRRQVGRAAVHVVLDDITHALVDVAVRGVGPSLVVAWRDAAGVRRTAFVTHAPRDAAGLGDGGRDVWVHVDGAMVVLHEPARFAAPVVRLAAGSLVAPMPAKVTAVMVAVGDRVTAGQTVLVVEAMKMEHALRAPADGVVEHLHVALGQQVAAGQLVAVVGAVG
jgi:acetyl/propionyl-CoA carboxylase alpha subunit